MHRPWCGAGANVARPYPNLRMWRLIDRKKNRVWEDSWQLYRSVNGGDWKTGMFDWTNAEYFCFFFAVMMFLFSSKCVPR